MSGTGEQYDSRGKRLTELRWFRALVTFCAVLVIFAVCIEAYRRANQHGSRQVEAHPIDARLEIHNPPVWLDRRIVQNLLDESYAFVVRDDATYHRARNILDRKILREIAELYTGSESVEGSQASRQAHGYNAWISRITEIRRTVNADKTLQTIEISAEWRKPAMWIRADNMLCLVDGEGVRLPGDYPLADRARSKLMVIAGVERPTVDGKPTVPQPGQRWTAGATGRLGDDLMAAMKLSTTLQDQAYAHQIDAIDMSNFEGRKDGRGAWILLDTIWPTAEGSPRVIQWGRPPGTESFREVHAAAKLKALNDIYLRFNRIDAGRDYVDIRWDTIWLPKLASQVEAPEPMVRG